MSFDFGMIWCFDAKVILKCHCKPKTYFFSQKLIIPMRLKIVIDDNNYTSHCLFT